MNEDRLDILKTKLSDASDALSGHIQVGKIPDMVSRLKKASDSKSTTFASLISHAALALIEKEKNPSSQSHVEEFLIKLLGPELTQDAFKIANLSVCLESFAYNYALALISPTQFVHRRPAHANEKQLIKLLVELGEVGEIQATEAVRRCKTTIEKALEQAVRSF